jgi:predicted aldo/keto reductase-like oxidoreductase
MDRRDFIKATAAGLAVSPAAGAQSLPPPPPISPIPWLGTSPENTTQGGVVVPTGPVTSRLAQNPAMKYRPLGRTGERLSMIGVGGFHLAKPGGPTALEAEKIVLTAIESGVTFFDNCWDYNGGESEIRLGYALRNGWRDHVFLMTKIDGRTAQAAQRQLDESLKRLRTDHLDLLQFHEIIRPEDPDVVFAPGNVLDFALRAREQGKIRYIGFTGHKSPVIHARMFQVADAHGFHFDTVQMPLNVMDAHWDSFEQTVLPIALAHGTGVLGMKTFGDKFIYESRVMPPEQMLHYAMSLPTALQVCGIDSLPILQQALNAVRSYHPLSPEERAAILAKSYAAAADGATELYKTSHHFDGTIQNPQWLGLTA